jgi:hypothetical protein
MKKIFAFIAPLFLSALLSAHPEEPGSPETDNVVWHSITVIDYKPGALDDAKAVIHKFEAASESAGTSLPVIYWFESGKYDLVLTWISEDGADDFQGKWSPDEEGWWNALVELEGSEEAAIKLQAEYGDLVASSITNVARKAK